jgi:N-acetylmuramoyl-L-alanine amidase
MAAVPVIAEVPFAARVIKEGERYLIQVPARPGLIYLLEVPDGAGGMTFAGVPGTAVYAQSDTVRWPLEVSGTVVGAEEEWNSAGASPPAAGGTVLLPLTIEVAESQGTHVRLRVDGASPWVAVAAATFPRVMFEGFADLPTATGVRSTALSTRVVTVPIGATEPGRAALTFEQQQEFDAILQGLPQLIAAATLPLGLPPALGNGSPSPLSSSRYFRVAMYQVDTNGNGYLDADELASGMNPFARPGESGYVDASNAGGNNGGNGGGIAPIWDSDDDFSPDFEEIAAGTSPMFKYSAPVVLTCQKFDRYAEFDSAGSWREREWGRIVGWERHWNGFHEEMLSWSPPSLLVGTTPRTLAGFMSDFASGWENPNPESGKGLPPQSLLEEYFRLPALIARQVKPVAGNPSVTSGYIRAIGDRYRLRGPLSSEDQHRQFLKVTWTQTTGFNENQFVEDAASSLMGQPLLEQEPTSVEVVTLTIPRGSLYSAPHDVVPQYSVPNGPANPEMPHSQVGEYLKVVRLLPIEVVDLAPKLKDETGTEIADSNKPVALPKANGMVEEDAANNRIAHRELKVSIGSALKDKKVTWSMEAKFTPTGASQPRFRGDWATAAEAHRNRFEASTTYGANAYRTVSQEQGETTVDANGFTAIRVNVPPWGLNKARIKIQIEGSTTPIELIDLEVPGVIVIDPGHGVGAAGGSNAIGGSGVTTGALEHEFALDIGTRMAADLRRRRDAERLPVKVYMTRTGTGNLSFPDRTRVARENGCDVYVSIHFNGVDGVPLRRHPFGMWDSTGNQNLSEDQALAVRLRQAVQRAIAAVEPEESRNAATDGITSETHEANLQKGLDTCSDSTNNTTPNYNGNIPGHTPCRAALIELEWMSNNRADLLFNEGNASLSSTADRMREEAAQAMADASIEDLYTQPAQ